MYIFEGKTKGREEEGKDWGRGGGGGGADRGGRRKGAAILTQSPEGIQVKTIGPWIVLA